MIKATITVLLSLEIQGEDLDFWLSTAPPAVSSAQPQVRHLARRRKVFLAVMRVLCRAAGEKGETGGVSSAFCWEAMTFYLPALQTLSLEVSSSFCCADQ